MNKQDFNKVTTLYKSGGIAESLITEIIIRKNLSQIPGLKLELEQVDAAVRQAADQIDTFYKWEVSTQNGQ